MRIALVTDPLDRLDPSIDTSVGLMHAAADRGAEVWVTQAHMLEAAHGRARALARRVRLAPSRPAGDHRWIVAKRWYTATEPQHVWLDEMAAVFMRTEPPVDQAFVTATLILDLIDTARTPVINDPRGLRACSEHLLGLHFPDLCPPTIVTADEHDPGVPGRSRRGCGQAGRRLLRPGSPAPRPARPEPWVADRDLHAGGHPCRRPPAVPARGLGGEQADLRGRGRTGRCRVPVPARRRLPDRRPGSTSSGHRTRPGNLCAAGPHAPPPRHPPGRS